jgi:hypothetical protein
VPHTGKPRGSKERREFGRRTQGGKAHREAEVAASAARKAVRSGGGAATGVDERLKERGRVLVAHFEGRTEEGKTGHGGGGLRPF